MNIRKLFSIVNKECDPSGNVTTKAKKRKGWSGFEVFAALEDKEQRLGIKKNE